MPHYTYADLWKSLQENENGGEPVNVVIAPAYTTRDVGQSAGLEGDDLIRAMTRISLANGPVEKEAVEAFKEAKPPTASRVYFTFDERGLHAA